MPTLALFITSIDSMRDIFGAAPELAAQLRAIAAEEFNATPPPSRTLLGRLGPLFKRHPETEVQLNRPIPRDVDALLSGSFIEAERLPQAWRVLLAWLNRLSSHHAVIHVADWDALEYDLGRAGLASQYALRQLAARDLGIPLRAMPGQVTGYGKHQQAVETRNSLRELLERPDHELTPATLAVVAELLALLDHIDEHTQPTPDLLAIQPPGDAPSA